MALKVTGTHQSDVFSSTTDTEIYLMVHIQNLSNIIVVFLNLIHSG